jgi:hypothetical protein
MMWAAFFAVTLLAAWLEESKTRKAEIGVTLVLLIAVLAYMEIVHG